MDIIDELRLPVAGTPKLPDRTGALIEARRRTLLRICGVLLVATAGSVIGIPPMIAPRIARAHQGRPAQEPTPAGNEELTGEADQALNTINPMNRELPGPGDLTQGTTEWLDEFDTPTPVDPGDPSRLNNNWPRRCLVESGYECGYEVRNGNPMYFVVKKKEAGSHKIINRRPFGNCRISADVELEHPGPNGIFLIARAQDPNTYYRIVLFQGQGVCRLVKVINDRPEILFENADLPFANRSGFNRLGIEAIGSHWRGYINGQVVGSAEDGTFDQGATGFGVVSPIADATGWFDNWEVSTP